MNTPRLVGGMVVGEWLGEFARAYLGVVLDIAVNDNFVGIVGEGFNAGIWLGESIAQDMVAMRLTPDLPVIVVGAPSHLAAHPAAIETPADLRAHACIDYRMGASRTLCDWDLENAKRRSRCNRNAPSPSTVTSCRSTPRRQAPDLPTSSNRRSAQPSPTVA